MPRKILYFLLLLVLSAAVMAGTKGRIKGKVVDRQTGEPLIGANVMIAGSSFGSATDASGEYLIMNVDPGSYDLQVTYIGYQGRIIKGVRVNADLTAYQDFELSSEDISVGTIEVVAKRPLIQKDATNATRVTTGEDIQSLPVRGLNSIVQIQAGVSVTNGTITIRGGRQDEVGYVVEGMSGENPMTGGRGLTVSSDAIEEVQVQTGGYTAELGGANSGMVRTQYRTGSPELKVSFSHQTDNLSFKGKKDFLNGKKFLGAYSYGYDESSFSVGGPIFDKRFRFFLNYNYTYLGDRGKGNIVQAFPELNLGVIKDRTTGDSINFTLPGGPVKGNSRDIHTLTGTLSFDFNPVMIRLSGSYAKTRNDRYNNDLTEILNSRKGEQLLTDGVFSAKITHILSPTMYYEITGGYGLQTDTRQDPYLKDNMWAYGDSVANAAAGYTFKRSATDLAAASRHGRYIAPQPLTVFGISYNTEGNIAFGYRKSDYRNFEIKGNFNLLIGKIHSIKIGGEYKKWSMRNYIPTGVVGLASSLNTNLNDPKNAGKTLDQIKEEILRIRGTDHYGYDIFGNEYNGDDDFMRARKPVFAAAFIMDKIEYQDIILNIGLRYEYINVDNKQPVNLARPDLAADRNTGELYTNGWEDVGSFSSVSPRLGISFPITESTVFHAQFGKFVQQTRLQDIYQAPVYTAYTWRQTYAFLGAPGFNVRPTRTTNYELGFTQQLNDYMSFDITGYYKDIKDQAVFTEIKIDKAAKDKGFRDYYALINGDYNTTKGIEITFNMRRYQRLSINASMTYSDARGTGSGPYQNAGIVGAPIDPEYIFVPKFISPISTNIPFTSSINLDYRWGVNDGPAVLENFGLNLLATLRGGHGYTRGDGVLNLENDQRGRYPIEPLNSSMTPTIFQIDLKIDKTFKLFDKLTANIFVRVLNLFDTKNIENPFQRTGAADDDGVISNPVLLGNKIEQYGSKYLDYYKAINIDRQLQFTNATANYLYAQPRQFILGIRLDY